jgi:hypothetical protein
VSNRIYINGQFDHFLSKKTSHLPDIASYNIQGYLFVSLDRIFPGNMEGVLLIDLSLFS